MFVYEIYLHAILFLNKMLPMTFDALSYAATYKKSTSNFLFGIAFTLSYDCGDYNRTAGSVWWIKNIGRG